MVEAILNLHVTDYRGRPIDGARIMVGDVVAEGDSKGKAEIALDRARKVEVRVEARSFEAQSRLVSRRDLQRLQVFMLGRPGMPYYFRGTVRVPFEPLPGVLGVMTKPDGAAQGAQKDRGRRPAASARDTTAQRIGGRSIRSGGNFERSGVTIVQLPEDQDAVAEGLRALEEDPGVEAAGAVVRLTDENASFLTTLIIARFEEGVEEAEVERVAKRHGLAAEGRFTALGNVHRLRFPGPATYAVLDAANALAGEPEVIYAEPSLASTTEEDAIVPTDFLFPEQWDHQIINTPDAWQALRDMDPARTFGSGDVVVAVVDSGVDLTHPEFTGTVPGGAAKQVAMFDFARMAADMNNLGGDHGTCCASAAVANVNNASAVVGVNEGVAGVAGASRLIAIRSGGTEARFAEMYLWAAGFDAGSTTAGFPAQLARGADVITNSFGFSVNTPISGLMSDTFDRLTDDGRGGRGVLLYFSAGNQNVDLDATFRRPWSMYERCFGVAASTLGNDGMTEIKAAYSNFGSTVDWCAPSNDNEGRHNPPGVFGAHTATIRAAPEGDAICGVPAQQTTLAAAATAGATVLTLANAAGFGVGQAVVAGALGGGVASGRRITAVNAGMNQITLDSGLGDALPLGAPVAAGPRQYRTDFGGTSYATPVSAGVGALIISANPELTWQQVRDLCRSTAVKIDANNTNAVGRWRDVNGRISTDPGYLGANFSEFFGFGRLDAAAAVRDAGWRIALTTPALNFNDIPEGETTVRAVRFDVQSLWPVSFEIVALPGAPFTTPLGIKFVSPGTPSSSAVREVILWLGYTGTTAGDVHAGSVTVRCLQTGRQWIIPITANTVVRQSACVMLCLDRSGSMLSPSGIGAANRIDVLRFSAEIMIDVVHEGDGVGIVSFDHDPFDLRVPLLGPLGPVTVFDIQRDQLRSDISTFAPNPLGFTAIGDGVERAQTRLAPVAGYGTKSVVVFTDGKETDAKYISDVAGSITDRVFAVALGRAENVQPTALTALTNGTGGFCMLTGALDINSRYKLAKYFLQVLAGVKNEDVVRDPDGLLGPGQVHDIDFHLAETDIATDVILMTPARGSIDMTLVTPAGDVIDQAAAAAMPGGLYFDGRNVSYYRLTLPAPVGAGAREGRWTARLQLSKRGHYGAFTHFQEKSAAAVAASRSGAPYSLLVHSYSNLRMATTLSQTGFAPGATLVLRARLTEYGIPVERRAQVSARVVDPDGAETTVLLAETAPGLFDIGLPAPLPGSYDIRVTARGKTLRGRAFTREAVRTGAVWIGGDRPPPSSDGNGGNGGKDAFCDFLGCLLSSRVVRPELRERLRAVGIDLDALRKCVGGICENTEQAEAQSRLANLDPMLFESLRAMFAGRGT
ncbi:VWA domain-containing protein [Paracoccus liaowanqingii]|uniref:VWA domain-containing protein n=1 Tax=Paracoccus liaowanqingii TaxID=2560053 RepID=A0A4P7HLL6_9RHOB|nr:VWA domain-containing protein [Paracoccus liaowanqingii]